jgi:glucose/arabinose dehydrogenase
MFPRRHESTTQARSSLSDAGPGSRRAAILLTVAVLGFGVPSLAGCGSDETTATTPPVSGGPPAPTPAPEAPTRPGDGDGGVELTEIGTFTAPLYVDQPRGSDDLYVVQQGGQIVRVTPDGEQSTFLDISSEIVAGGEQGLLSVAFAPDFDESGLLYVDYTDTAGDTRVVEYRSEDGGDTADPGSARELLRVEQPYANHNGGLVEFGPDGRLYVGLGDGGGAGDPERSAQDPENPLGKILALDPSADGAYDIYALGLRNPWRFSFDRETGALAIGDVGQASLEEVNLVPPGEGEGANFGWSAFEGTEAFNSDQKAPGATEPVLTYPTDSGANCSVTGGYVVRDPRLSSLWGRYLYGDFCAGQLRSFTADPGEPATDDKPVGDGIGTVSLSSFGEDEAGRIYVTSLEGPVYRLDPASP